MTPATAADERRAVAFYEQALTSAEKADLETAREVQGLDEEIAVLRLRLRRAIEEQPENFGLMLRGIDILARLVARRYRLPQEPADEIQAAMYGLLESLGFKTDAGKRHDG